MVSVSVWLLLTAVAFWLLVVPRAARSSLYLTKYTARSNSAVSEYRKQNNESNSSELLSFFCVLMREKKLKTLLFFRKAQNKRGCTCELCNLLRY